MNYSPASLSPGQLVVVGILTAVVGFWISRKTYGFTRFAIFLIALAFAVPSTLLAVGQNPWLVDARFRTFKMLYWNIHTGMSRADVLRAVGDTYPHAEGAQATVVSTETSNRVDFSLNPLITGSKKQESFHLTMEAGVVIGKSYGTSQP